ncbi:alpha/beta hydrolase family protein [bacterium BMS3Abin05]|nr:alpha/beta hydrolase family protein [bacterium BMS3Abin05]GBE28611.1 alpha/beta hydrolase family protein [bacterium BMS3Bbin03]HDZ12111.1 alpha/beta fold hydrolase [Bacteroidota bacterium]
MKLFYRTIIGIGILVFLIGVFLFAKKMIVRNRSTMVSVTIRSSDNWELKGSYYRPLPPIKKAPGLLLLPAFNGDRKSYEKTAPFFQKRGYGVLTIDLRDMGESRQKGKVSNVPDLKGIDDDVRAAIDFLGAQKAVDNQQIGVLAASTVGDAAVLAIDHDSRIKGVVLLSGAYDSTAVHLLESAEFPPALIVASYDDKIATKNASLLMGKLQNPKSKVKLFLNAGHGLNMFWSPKGRELGTLVLNWFEKYVKE